VLPKRSIRLAVRALSVITTGLPVAGIGKGVPYTYLSKTFNGSL
jgi:hypothetical protein